MKVFMRTWLLVLILAAAAFGGGFAASSGATDAAAGTPAPAPPLEASAPVAELSEAFERVAEVIAPSVVTIRAVKEVQTVRHGRQPFFFGSPFEFFGEDFFDRFEFDVPDRPWVRQGQGSGVIVDHDGYILTNSHVVSGADEVMVVLPDGREYSAEVIGTDPKTDLAVIRIPGDGLQPATLGDSDDLRVGQWIVAAGNPFGLSSTITAGIVSATGRSRVGVADYEDFIQTDAAINPGNSGGPLVNIRGEVVGINTAIFTRGGGNNGVGFAIPINMARSVMEDLIEDGRVVRGYLGVMIQDLDEGMAESFGYEGTDGALVGDVTTDGPADRAGLRPGDIITRFDGRRVTTIDRLRLDVAATEPGREVPVEIFRDGATTQLEVEIGELPEQLAAGPTRESADVNVGMTVRTLTPEIARRLGLDESVTGVVVTGVEPLGPAARAGIRPRDVITHVQDEAVTSASAFRAALRRVDLEDGVRLVIRNATGRRFAFLKLRE